MKETFFKVGQKVWEFAMDGLREGVVAHIYDDGDYPISVDFDNYINVSFTFDGRRSKASNPSLFQTKPIITPNTPSFNERPAYFWDDSRSMWIYGMLSEIDCQDGGKDKISGFWFIKWQTEAPDLRNDK
jgi:hypothetical protein